MKGQRPRRIKVQEVPSVKSLVPCGHLVTVDAIASGCRNREVWQSRQCAHLRSTIPWGKEMRSCAKPSPYPPIGHQVKKRVECRKARNCKKASYWANSAPLTVPYPPLSQVSAPLTSRELGEHQRPTQPNTTKPDENGNNLPRPLQIPLPC